MKLLIDGDGCPVVDITVRLAGKHGVRCVIYCDTSHRMEKDGAETVTVSRGADSADFALVNAALQGDVAVTQDYGLAAMCLAKGVRTLNQDGRRYTADNIGGLLEERHVSRKVRRGGGRLKGPPKREPQQDKAFEAALEELLSEDGG